MKILIACECSGRVRDAMRARGHDAYSCDLEPNDSKFHLQCDVRELLKSVWGQSLDFVGAHPPCDFLTISNNNAMTYGCSKYTAEQGKELRAKAVAFFMLFTKYKGYIENPVGIMSKLYRKPDQYIQPWMFGHGECKNTGLWLNGLPPLKPSNIVPGREQNIWKMPPGPKRKAARSVTYQGIADAMALQWG